MPANAASMLANELEIDVVGKGLAGNNLAGCQLWWHVSNVPMCNHFRGMARFQHAPLRHVKNVPPHGEKESGSYFPNRLWLL